MRTIRATDEIAGYVRFPGVRQVFVIERTRECQGRVAKTTHDVTYGVTSLSAQAASPERLLQLVRGHWGIENRTHWVRDVTFDEDRCRARRGRSAWMLATLRNVVIGLLRWAGATNVAEALRACAWSAPRALRLIGVRVA